MKKILTFRSKKFEFSTDINEFLGNRERTDAKEFLALIKSKSLEFIDDYRNVFVQLPTIWLKLDKDKLLFSLEEKRNSIILQPQAISKYKNSLIRRKIRSIPNVAPNFSQFSFNKSTQFCNWVYGEQLNWRTVLYIQIMWKYAYETKKNNDILRNELSYWMDERDTYWEDTGKGIGEFLGVEQFFTSGKNFVDLSNNDTNSELWNLYKKWNFDQDFDPTGKYARWGDYDDPYEDSYAPFSSSWGSGYHACWGHGKCTVRLCKDLYKKIDWKGY